MEPLKIFFFEYGSLLKYLWHSIRHLKTWWKLFHQNTVKIFYTLRPSDFVSSAYNVVYTRRFILLDPSRLNDKRHNFSFGKNSLTVHRLFFTSQMNTKCEYLNQQKDVRNLLAVNIRNRSLIFHASIIDWWCFSHIIMTGVFAFNANFKQVHFLFDWQKLWNIYGELKW